VTTRPGERRGAPASPGIAIAPAYVLRRERLMIPEYRIEESQVDAEVERLERAFVKARGDIEKIRADFEDTGLVGNILESYSLFLADPTLRDQAFREIRESLRNAEWALSLAGQRIEALFQSIGDPYIRERSSDVSYSLRRVLRALLGHEPEGLKNAPPGVIVVAEDLSPAEVAQVTRADIAGLVTEAGSRTSHVTIMARSLRLPAIVGAGPGLAAEISDGMLLVVDGGTGRLIIDPDERTVADYERQQGELRVISEQLLRYADLPAETVDGVAIKLMANVDLPEEIPDALRYGAEGIGLYRTEFLFLNRGTLPSEEEQEAAYREILQAVAPRRAVIRTLDLGADKVPGGVEVGEEPNPALGLRGLRLSLHRPEVFRAQLRALFRASRFGQLRILLPMVSNLAELDFAHEELLKAHEEVRREAGVPEGVEVGVMIETPAAAMIAELIAARVDFLSIGTNDLLQYTLAVDRANEQVSYLYEPLHPAHLRMIQRTTQAARRAGIVVGMCGEMASDPAHAWILMALGVDELSMAPFAIPLLKKIIRESTLAEARELLSDALRLGNAGEIRERIVDVMSGRFPAEFERLTDGG
jgi:phosphotransferase system enzyme I (PtsI)